jgi:hypothetical protein
MPSVKTCFVVMGFGEKTDFQSTPQRVLNPNRTYEDIIEPAVTDVGSSASAPTRALARK